MTSDRPRKTMAACAGSLRYMPLDESSVSNLRCYPAHTTSGSSHDATLTLYTCDLADGEVHEASPGVLRHAPELGVAEHPPEPRVRYESDAGASTRAQIELASGTDLYGAGELAAGLRRNGRNVQLWNTDAYGYGEQDCGTYQSHPFVLALTPEGAAVGIVADCARRGWIALSTEGSVEFRFEGGPFSVLLIDAEDPAQVIAALSALTGSIELPPLWALGYHQCRYSYMDAEEVRALATRFRTERVPCDGLWFDLDYMDRCRNFTWNTEAFPDPAELTAELRSQGFHSVAILDVGIVVDAEDPTCASGLEGEHFVTDRRGAPALGRVWPGPCHFPDFTRAETRAWWATLVEQFVRASGLDGVWNDMNEPAVFRTPTRTLRDDLVHRGMGGGSHAQFHNLYGHLSVSATHAGALAARPGRRPFVLTRSGNLSTGAIAATWTGDNQSCWEDYVWSIPMAVSLGLCAQPFSGPDVGGFAGDPDPELFVRWFGLGAYLPFFRGHAEKGTCRKEPWAFGEEVLAHVRAAIEQRMRLLPVLYTLFEQAARTGQPIVRPLFFADPRDARLRALDDELLLGPDLLVAPVVERGADSRRVTLPAGGWYELESGEYHGGLEATLDAPLGTTPALARAGSIVTLGGVRQHVLEADDQRELLVFLDSDGAATGSLYEDSGDGDTDGHARVQLAARTTADGVELTHRLSGASELPARTWHVRVWDSGGAQGRADLVGGAPSLLVELG